MYSDTKGEDFVKPDDILQIVKERFGDWRHTNIGGADESVAILNGSESVTISDELLTRKERTNALSLIGNAPLMLSTLIELYDATKDAKIKPFLRGKVESLIKKHTENNL